MPPVRAVRDIVKSFRRGLGPRRRTIEVLRGASMDARPGELIGLVGENGSGKRSLLKIIVGMLDRDSGEVERRGRLGYCPQVPLLWGKLTVREHFDLFASAYEIDFDQLAQTTERMLAELQFRRYVDYRVEELSGSTRQKLNLRFRSCTTRICCSSTSPTAASIGRPTCASGRSARSSAPGECRF